MSNRDGGGAAPPQLALQALLERLATPGSSAEFTYWDRGGPPGAGYESNHLTVAGNENETRVVYLKTRFDPDKPPYKSEEFELPPQPKRMIGYADVAKRLCSETFPEETPAPIGDVTKLTLTVQSGDLSVDKTFYEKMPAALVPFEDQLKALIVRCEKEGKATVVD